MVRNLLDEVVSSCRPIRVKEGKQGEAILIRFLHSHNSSFAYNLHAVPVTVEVRRAGGGRSPGHGGVSSPIRSDPTI